MSEAKFTSGPWIAVQGASGYRAPDDQDWRIDAPAEMMTTGIIFGGASITDFDLELEANAHLIAAAPEMFGVLERVSAILWLDGGYNGFAREIDRLIAKACGG